ncbi:MAG: chorismate synthase, partial [Candidatus Kariarchaeaceae archaeon]
MNTFGKNFRLTLIGSSHSSLVGVVIDGIPSGIDIDIELISSELQKRRPGQSNVTTDRKEEDRLIIKTGLYNGITNGQPFVAYVRNKDIDSSYYDEIKHTPRPGHADYPAYVKYRGTHDNRGGGRFSGRMTVGLVIAGAIAKQILREYKIHFTVYSKQIGEICGNPEDYNLGEDYIFSAENLVRVADPQILSTCIDKIREMKQKGDSIGGIIECVIDGIPVGVGEPWFQSIESMISQMMFSIPAVKGIEFGSGFYASKMQGSEHNDEFYIDENGRIKTRTNYAGGILGGLSNGMPIV